MDLYLEKLSSGGNSSFVELIILKNILKNIYENVSLEIEFHEMGNDIGHWSLKNGEEPPIKGKYPNNCLFDVLAWTYSKGKLDPDSLRKLTMKYLNQLKFYYPKKRVDNLLKLSKYFKAGASYYPKNPQEAGHLLNECNGQQPHYKSTYAHPRGHSSSPNILVKNENVYKSVENYSMQTPLPTGFLTQEDQNTLFHIIMQSSDAEYALNRLNQGDTEAVFTVNRNDLNEMIKVANWKLSKRVTDYHLPRGYTILLAHQRGSNNDQNAPVFVHTFYPRLRGVSIKDDGWDQ